MDQDTRPRRFARSEHCFRIEYMVVSAKSCNQMVDPDLATKIGIGSIFTERKLTLCAAPTTLSIGIRAIEARALEGCRAIILADCAGAFAHCAAFCDPLSPPPPTLVTLALTLIDRLLTPA